LIPGQSSFAAPIAYRRSQDFTISSTIQFNCNRSLSVVRRWSIKACNSSGCWFELDLTGKVDTGISEFYAAPQTLAYGRYQLTLHIQQGGNATLTSSSFVFIKIIPSVISPNSLPWGTSTISSSTHQDLLLDPGSYSINPDEQVFDATVSSRCHTEINERTHDCDLM
jgi:hypothetical protein